MYFADLQAFPPGGQPPQGGLQTLRRRLNFGSCLTFKPSTRHVCNNILAMMVDPWIFQLLQLAVLTFPMYLLIILLELLLLSQSHAIQLAKNQQRELTFNDPVIIFSTYCL